MQNRRMRRSTVHVQAGGVPAALEFLSGNPTPQMLILESDAAGEALFQELAKVAEVCDPNSRVVVLGQQNDINIYKELMSMGLSEYACGAVTPDHLFAIIERIFSNNANASLGRVIAFIGARGGVGSSAVAANTAYALGQMFKEGVILIDLDLSFGTAAISLNMQQSLSITDALSQPDRLDNVLIERFLMKYDDQMRVIPSPSSVAGPLDISVEAFEVLMKLVRPMASFVVLDMPHTWSPWVQDIVLDANEVVVTALPDLANARDVKNLFELLVPKRGVDAPVRLVFNRAGLSKTSELTAKDFEDAASVRPAAVIPFEPKVFAAALNSGNLVVQASKGSKAAKQFTKLATVVSARILETEKSKSLLTRLRKLLK